MITMVTLPHLPHEKCCNNKNQEFDYDIMMGMKVRLWYSDMNNNDNHNGDAYDLISMVKIKIMIR